MCAFCTLHVNGPRLLVSSSVPSTYFRAMPDALEWYNFLQHFSPSHTRFPVFYRPQPWAADASVGLSYLLTWDYQMINLKLRSKPQSLSARNVDVQAARLSAQVFIKTRSRREAYDGQVGIEGIRRTRTGRRVNTVSVVAAPVKRTFFSTEWREALHPSLTNYYCNVWSCLRIQNVAGLHLHRDQDPGPQSTQPDWTGLGQCAVRHRARCR